MVGLTRGDRVRRAETLGAEANDGDKQLGSVSGRIPYAVSLYSSTADSAYTRTIGATGAGSGGHCATFVLA